ncbi:MAG: lysoplasmalogenase [Cyclobacteriaceae bacterium]|nr:lysoplasmalogenase [Cyclobacteriaceae bacterium]
MRSDKLTLYFFILVSVTHLLFLLIPLESLQFVSKPLIIPSLAIHVLSLKRAKKINFSPMLWIAMILAWGGDISLMFEGESMFIIGLLCFLLTQIIYILLYRGARDINGEPLNMLMKIRYSFSIIVIGIAIYYLVLPFLGDLIIPVAAYVIVIVLMALNAVYRYGMTNNASFWVVLTGALLFMTSDSLLAIDTFLPDITVHSFWVMSTYIVAQYLIIYGLLKHFD